MAPDNQTSPTSMISSASVRGACDIVVGETWEKCGSQQNASAPSAMGASRWHICEFFHSLSAVYNAVSILEYDVEDCFLNSPQAKVRPALEYWLASLRATGRRASCFAISKDCPHKLNRVGASSSLHFWDFSLCNTRDCLLADTCRLGW